jgi:hypothetical protein
MSQTSDHQVPTPFTATHIHIMCVLTYHLYLEYDTVPTRCTSCRRVTVYNRLTCDTHSKHTTIPCSVMSKLSAVDCDGDSYCYNCACVRVLHTQLKGRGPGHCYEENRQEITITEIAQILRAPDQNHVESIRNPPVKPAGGAIFVYRVEHSLRHSIGCVKADQHRFRVHKTVT